MIDDVDARRSRSPPYRSENRSMKYADLGHDDRGVGRDNYYRDRNLERRRSQSPSPGYRHRDREDFRRNDDRDWQRYGNERNRLQRGRSRSRSRSNDRYQPNGRGGDVDSFRSERPREGDNFEQTRRSRSNSFSRRGRGPAYDDGPSSKFRETEERGHPDERRRDSRERDRKPLGRFGPSDRDFDSRGRGPASEMRGGRERNGRGRGNANHPSRERNQNLSSIRERETNRGDRGFTAESRSVGKGGDDRVGNERGRDASSRQPPKKPVQPVAPMSGLGRGRGRGKTLPAWMTTGNMPQEVIEKAGDSRRNVAAQKPTPSPTREESALFRGPPQKKSRVAQLSRKQIDKAPPPHRSVRESLAPVAGMGRGRGRGGGLGRGKNVNLPAWMTANKD